MAQQRYFAVKSTVTFFSDGLLEDITASNESVTSIFDPGKGEIAFLIKTRDFQFDKKLMQVHFNEKFMESERYPKSTFQGHVAGFNRSKEGIQEVTALGRLFIHGVSRDVVIPGTVERKGENLLLKSKFLVKLADYNITIPQVVWQNISEEVVVNVNFLYNPL